MGSCLAKGKGPAYQLSKRIRRAKLKKQEENDLSWSEQGSSGASPVSPGSDLEDDNPERVRELRVKWVTMNMQTPVKHGQGTLSRKEQFVAHSARGRNYCSVSH